MSTDATSDRIKRAALARFAEVGYGSATVDDIASGAGVGVATLYRRWPDKAALANELILDYLDHFDEVLTPVAGGTRKSRFVALWRRLWHLADENSDLFLFFESHVHAGFMTDAVAARKATVVNRWIDSIDHFGIGADPIVAASMLMGTLTAMRRGGFPTDPDDLAERLWAALRTP